MGWSPWAPDDQEVQVLTFSGPRADPTHLLDWQPECADLGIPSLTYTGVPVAVQVEARTAGAPVAANAILTSLLTGGP
jgi:hypothetical protein